MLTMKLETKELDDYLFKIKKQQGSLRLFFNVVIPILHTSILTNFRVAGRPKKWQQLSPMTIAIRTREGTFPGSVLGQPILQRYGTLRASIGSVRVVGENYCEYGTRLEKAPSLQYGREAMEVEVDIPAHIRRITQAWGRPISPREITVRSHRRRVKFGAVPARPFIMFQKDDVKRITAYAAAFAFDPDTASRLEQGMYKGGD